jgi:outer membrane protein OmpA-like peptidoglycan-associated protein
MARNYEEGLRRAGFELLFTCRREQCGNSAANQPGLAYWPYDSSNTMVARKRVDGQEIWVVIDARSNQTLVNVIRPKEMERGLVAVDAAALKKGLADEGHVAVYGIHFDSGRAEPKPSSAPALAEIVRLLRENPALRIHVVGHTDNVGGWESNLALSRSRAAAVVKELTSPPHGIPASRLAPQGVGPLVPLATNRTEEGRARNRRVDLVEQ